MGKWERVFPVQSEPVYNTSQYFVPAAHWSAGSFERKIVGLSISVPLLVSILSCASFGAWVSMRYPLACTEASIFLPHSTVFENLIQIFTFGL